MKQFGYVTLVFALILGMASVGFAQGKITTGKDGATAITVSGEIDLDYVYRSGTANEVRGVWAGGASTDATPGTNFVNGYVKFRFDIAVADGVDAVVTLENNRFTTGQLATSTWGAEFGLAYIVLREVYNKDLNVTLGVQDFKLDSLGDGNPFFMDVRGSESAWDQAVNGVNPLLTNTVLWHPVGISFDYNAAPVSFKLFGALVNTNDGGTSTSQEEFVYGMNFGYDLEGKVAGLAKGGALNLLATMFVGGGAATTNNHSEELWTLGIGLNLKDLANVKGLSIYGEGYWQFGDAGEVTIANSTKTLDAGGWAARGGLRYDFDNPNKPWISFEYWMLSGDDDTTDSDYNNFVSYENVNDFLIVENQLYGLDVDTNYTALKFKGGISTAVGGKNLDLTLKLGFFEFNEERPVGGVDNDEDLGSELDFTAKLDYAKNVSFDLTVAWLWSADALEETYTLDGTEAEDDATAFLLGANVKF